MIICLIGYKTFLLLDDIIAGNSLYQIRNPLIDIAISGRHSLWFLAQSYPVISRNIRRQGKILYVWYPKDRNDFKTIHHKNDVIETKEEVNEVKRKLREGKHTCLIMRIEHPRGHQVCCNDSVGAPVGPP